MRNIPLNIVSPTEVMDLNNVMLHFIIVGEVD